jgi:hypothetical protein
LRQTENGTQQVNMGDMASVYSPVNVVYTGLYGHYNTANLLPWIPEITNITILYFLEEL